MNFSIRKAGANLRVKENGNISESSGVEKRIFEAKGGDGRVGDSSPIPIFSGKGECSLLSYENLLQYVPKNSFFNDKKMYFP